MLIYIIINILSFYLLPLFISDTGSAMLILLIIIPIITLVSSLVYGIKNKFNLVYCISIGIIFIPTIFIYYNSSATIYIFIYTFLALLGNYIGTLFSKYE